MQGLGLDESQIIDLCKTEKGVEKYIRSYTDEDMTIGYYRFIIFHPKEKYPKILEMVENGKLEQGITKGFFGVRFFWKDYCEMRNIKKDMNNDLPNSTN